MKISTVSVLALQNRTFNWNGDQRSTSLLRAPSRMSVGGLVLLAAMVLQPRVARAYRPFDGTDADVAPLRAVELEVGPVGYLTEGTSRYLIAPALIANYGVAEHFELVAEGKYATRLGVVQREPRSQLIERAVSIKQVVRSGVLQERTGVSIASEWSVLLPDTASNQRAGAQLTTIFSQRWSMLTVHVNIANELSPSTHYVAWFDPIIEGPADWTIRPVAELLATREFGSAHVLNGVAGSVLLGAIASVTNALTFDAATRMGRTRGILAREVRVGFTCEL